MREIWSNNAISHTLGRLPVSHYLADFPHHIPPCHNLHKQIELCEDEAIADATHFFKKFPYICSFPVPISPACKLPRKVLNGIDPVTTLIREKMKWEMKKRKILKSNKKNIKYINDKLLKTAISEVGVTTLLPRGVALLAAHLQSDPDSQFSGNYNWYYSGGNLATLSHLDETYLLSTNVLVPGVLSLAKLSQNGNVLEMDSALEPFTLDIPENINNESVLEIVTEKGCIATRQKNQLHIIKTTEEDGGIKLNTIHSVQSKQSINEGFISLALASQSEGDYCVLSNYGILRLYQLEASKKCVSSVKIKIGDGVLVSDKWKSVHYSDPNLLILTDRCCVHLLDLRCGLKEMQLAWCPKSKCERCEEISLCIPSSVKSHVKYIGTNHQAFSLDIRYGFSQRWTHMMHNTPYIGFTTTLNDSREMFLLGGQSQRSVSSIINTFTEEEEEAKSLILPFTLSSPIEGLQSVRSQGNCLEPTLRSRCNLSLTGLTYMRGHNGLFILRSTSVGDVFYQTFHDRRHSKKQIVDIDKWEASNVSEPVRATATVDFSDIFEAINNWNLSPLSWSQSKLSNYDNIDEHWHVSKSYLKDSVDMLAALILSVWDLDDEPEWKCPKENTTKELYSEKKVFDWLNNISGVPKSVDTTKLDEGLPQIIEKNENITETELFDLTNQNSYSLSQFLTPCISSPTLSKRSGQSLVSITPPSVKKMKRFRTLTEQAVENSQSQRLQFQTPKERISSWFLD